MLAITTRSGLTFFDIALEMFIENFTIPYAKWCEENGIMMTGHYMAEDTMRGQTEWIGAAMPITSICSFLELTSLQDI